MRYLILTMCLVFGLSMPAQAQEAEIEATISAQIEAFRADDFAQAFSYASPAIQGIFQTPDRFGAMVRGGYPMVWRPAEVQYLELREINGTLWQKVRITDASGRLHLLDYQMVKLGNDWKINGVQLLQSNELSA
jgi:hypothetical protein